MRLKIEKGRIAESETMVTSEKNGNNHFRPDLIGPSVARFGVVPANERMSRADLLKAARVIWSMEPGTALPAAESCKHYENFDLPMGGRIGCPVMAPRVMPRGRRTPLVDVERGVAVKYQLEDSSSPLGDFPQRDEGSGAEAKTQVLFFQPLTFYHLQLAKFSGGKYQVDERFMNIQPHGLPIVFRR